MCLLGSPLPSPTLRYIEEYSDSYLGVLDTGEGNGERRLARSTFEAHRPRSPRTTGLPIRTEDL